MNAMILTFALALQVPPQPQPVASTTITQAHRLSQEELKQLAHKERAAQIIKNRNKAQDQTLDLRYASHRLSAMVLLVLSQTGGTSAITLHQTATGSPPERLYPNSSRDSRFRWRSFLIPVEQTTWDRTLPEHVFPSGDFSGLRLSSSFSAPLGKSKSHT